MDDKIKMFEKKKYNSENFLFSGIEQAREEQVLLNMSTHDLTVRWSTKTDLDYGLRQLTPVDINRKNSQVIKMIQLFSS